jgi:hypothetical protein
MYLLNEYVVAFVIIALLRSRVGSILSLINCVLHYAEFLLRRYFSAEFDFVFRRT